MKPSHNPKDPDEPETPSNNLWVGNLSSEVTDSDLMSLFENHGALDGIASYTARSFAFVYFRRIEDAKSAKEALQGVVLKGHAIKIDFAKPPGKWTGFTMLPFLLPYYSPFMGGVQIVA
ncbi:unnamed protein product [Ilex paraguariensis]|uniref:RRM domain-containing protein n=1 Tax=Ilex paraguariensis TaxID=185542 RepID=A0ABC8RUR2_9AQUA